MIGQVTDKCPMCKELMAWCNIGADKICIRCSWKKEICCVCLKSDLSDASRELKMYRENNPEGETVMKSRLQCSEHEKLYGKS